MYTKSGIIAVPCMLTKSGISSYYLYVVIDWKRGFSLHVDKVLNK